MWSVLNGTIVNAAAVALGCIVGGLAGGRLPERFQRMILDVLGLVTITLGVDAAVVRLNTLIGNYAPVGEAGRTYGARLGLLMVTALVLGALLGTLLRIHERIEGLGQWLHRRLQGSGDGDASGAGDAKGGHRFAEGFLTASVIFCVGPLTLLGCLRNGMVGDPSYLYIKSLLDGFCALALTVSLGLGVAASILTVLLFQGGLAIAAYYAADGLPDLSVEMMNVVGGVLLIATALMILEIRRLPVANMLPAIALPPVFVAVAEAWQPGILITPLAERVSTL